MFPDRVLSGMRPTGALHIGHYHGALKNWVKLQDEHPCYFFVADWHALTTHYETPEVLAASVWDMVIDWFAAGLDPNKATVFIQSRVPEHAELFLLLSMATPLGWLERVPTYKDQIERDQRPRPGDLRLPRLPADAGGRHPDLPRDDGAGRRGPGAAHRDDARDRASLQQPVRTRTRLRGKGQGRGQEARRQARQALSRPAHGATRSRATTTRSSRRGRCCRRRRACRWATASARSATSKARAA